MPVLLSQVKKIVGIVNLASPAGVGNLALTVVVVILAQPVGVVNLVTPVGVVCLAVKFARTGKWEIRGRTTYNNLELEKSPVQFQSTFA